MEEHIRIGYMELLYIENAVRDLHDYEYVSRDPARGLWFKCYQTSLTLLGKCAAAYEQIEFQPKFGKAFEAQTRWGGRGI